MKNDSDIYGRPAKKRKWPLFLSLFVLIFVSGTFGGYVLLGKILGKAKPPEKPLIKTVVKPEDPDYSYLRVYYPIEGRLQMEERRVNRVSSRLAISEAVISEFLKGPSGVTDSSIPENTRLMGIYPGEDGIMYIDLSAEFRGNFSGDAMQEFLLLRGLYESILSNVYGVEDVKILVEGKEIESIGGHISLLKPLSETVSQTMEER